MWIKVFNNEPYAERGLSHAGPHGGGHAGPHGGGHAGPHGGGQAIFKKTRLLTPYLLFKDQTVKVLNVLKIVNLWGFERVEVFSFLFLAQISQNAMQIDCFCSCFCDAV